jgi:hypothetical protein
MDERAGTGAADDSSNEGVGGQPKPGQSDKAASGSGGDTRSGSSGPEAGRDDSVDQDRHQAETDEEQAAGLDDETLRELSFVVNYFAGPVDGRGGTFGFGRGTTARISTGRLDPAEIAAIVSCYIAPAPFANAERIIRTTNMVVIVGPEDIGRRAAAFALLHRMMGDRAAAGGAFSNLSPAISYSELAMLDVKPGRGYVILDHLAEMSASAIQKFEAERLQDRLSQCRSYLVITTTPAALDRRGIGSLCVDWQPPDPEQLFDRCLAEFSVRPPQNADLVRLRERVRNLGCPRDVIMVAAKVKESVEAALAALEDSERVRVEEWFKAERGPADVLRVSALAFAHGLPERIFERLLATLMDRAGANVATGAAEAYTKQTFEQTRVAWSDADGLICISQDRGNGRDPYRGERLVVFRSARYRELVIGELCDRYGYDLWAPLRAWLHDIAAAEAVGVRLRIAEGIALMARRALPEVEDVFLNAWSNGLAPERVTAAFVLALMCHEEALAPRALNIVLGWTSNSGQRRAVTAAMALAGELGAVYRLEALNWLWLLTKRGVWVAASAQRALALLFSACEEDPDRALVLLRYLHTQTGDAQLGGTPGVALRTVAAVLAAERLYATEPMAAFVLRTKPESAAILGALWGRVLLSTQRGSALKALCRVLDALRDDPSAAAAIRQLGDAVRATMSDEHCRALHRDLSAALHHPEYEFTGVQNLAKVLLASLAARRGKHPEL